MSSALTLHTDFGAGSPMTKDGDGDDQKHDYHATAAVPSEMDAVVVHEADGRARNRGAELPADERPQEMPAVFVAELADTSVANATAHDVEANESTGGSAARRKSLREPGRPTT